MVLHPIQVPMPGNFRANMNRIIQAHRHNLPQEAPEAFAQAVVDEDRY